MNTDLVLAFGLVVGLLLAFLLALIVTAARAAREAWRERHRKPAEVRCEFYSIHGGKEFGVREW
jgi:predicted RND superfamily exporter protein